MCINLFITDQIKCFVCVNKCITHQHYMTIHTGQCSFIWQSKFSDKIHIQHVTVNFFCILFKCTIRSLHNLISTQCVISEMKHLKFMMFQTNFVFLTPTKKKKCRFLTWQWVWRVTTMSNNQFKVTVKDICNEAKLGPQHTLSSLQFLKIIFVIHCTM